MSDFSVAAVHHDEQIGVSRTSSNSDVHTAPYGRTADRKRKGHNLCPEIIADAIWQRLEQELCLERDRMGL